MEEGKTSPVKNSKAKLPPYLLVLIILAVLILVGEGAYFLYLKGFKTSTGPSSTVVRKVAGNVPITIKNEYPALELKTETERIEELVLNSQILPGKNCFVAGQDKDLCFENTKLKIEISQEELVDPKTIRVNETEALHFTAQQGSEDELLVLFNFEGLDSIPKDLLEKMINRALLNALFYSAYDKDTGVGLGEAEEMFKQTVEAMEASGNYLVKIQ